MPTNPRPVPAPLARACTSSKTSSFVHKTACVWLVEHARTLYCKCQRREPASNGFLTSRAAARVNASSSNTAALRPRGSAFFPLMCASASASASRMMPASNQELHALYVPGARELSTYAHGTVRFLARCSPHSSLPGSPHHPWSQLSSVNLTAWIFMSGIWGIAGETR